MDESNKRHIQKSNTLYISIMKKALTLLTALTLTMLTFAFTSCDDDDTPDVDFALSVENGKIYDGNIYVVRGDTLIIDSLRVTAVSGNPKCGIINAAYFVDGYKASPDMLLPDFGFKFGTAIPSDSDTGTHLGIYRLLIEMTVVQEGKAVGIAAITYNIVVVESESDIPTNSAKEDSGAATVKS